jgi:hypothetical protein
MNTQLTPEEDQAIQQWWSTVKHAEAWSGAIQGTKWSELKQSRLGDVVVEVYRSFVKPN